ALPRQYGIGCRWSGKLLRPARGDPAAGGSSGFAVPRGSGASGGAPVGSVCARFELRTRRAVPAAGGGGTNAGAYGRLSVANPAVAGRERRCGVALARPPGRDVGDARRGGVRGRLYAHAGACAVPGRGAEHAVRDGLAAWVQRNAAL